MIVVFFNEKGGVGKTLLCFNAAIQALKEGKKIAVCDFDPQKSLTHLVGRRVSFGHRPSLPILSRKELLTKGNDYDDIFIDTPGVDTQLARNCLEFADVVVVPFRMGVMEADVLIKNAQVISHVRETENSNMKVYIVWNSCETTMGKNQETEAQEFFDLDIFKAFEKEVPKVYKRVIHAKAFAEGQGVVELENMDPKAAQEIKNFYKTISE